METIKNVYLKYNYMLDPHTAVAFASLEQYLTEYPDKKGFVLGTAHPVKFPNPVEKATKAKVEIPDSLQDLIKREKKTVEINSDFEELRRFLLNKN